MNNKVSVYLASGWFTPRTRDILDKLEFKLSNREDVDLYSPRRDGIMLPPNQKHDTELRESIFKENIKHIVEADMVLANIDSKDSYNDPGTIYEVGYAMANDIPVVGFSLGGEENIDERFKGIRAGFECILTSYEEVDMYFESYQMTHDIVDHSKKVLFVGAGNKDIDSKLASYIMDSGANLRWVNEVHSEIYSRIDEIFEDVEYMIAVIDDRKTIVSWMIGQAYARGIPVITYSDYNYMINIMLLVSVRTHLRGTDELVKFLQQVKREGLDSIPPFDISDMNAC